MNSGGTPLPPLEGDASSIASEVDRLLFWILEHKAEKRYQAFRQACEEHPDLAQAVEKRYRFMFAAQIVADFDDPEPKAIHSYHILRKLGQGGMGAVYEAEQQEPLRRKVALKVVKSGLDSRQVLRRFEKERQALARLSHSNIAKIFEAGLTPEGRPWFAMELLDGQPIDVYARKHALSIEDCIQLLLQVCHGVGHAHRAGILHRDIKPSNLFVIEEDGRPLVKIIDFGLAQIPDEDSSSGPQTLTGQWIGTPGYASPEQLSLRPEDVSPRSDVYSIGILAWLLLVGDLPESLGSPKGTLAYLEWMQLLEKGEVPRPSTVVSSQEVARISSLRGGLDWILLKAFAADPRDRYESCDQLASDLQAFLNGQPLLATGPSLPQRCRTWIRRHRAWMSLAALLLLVLTGALIVSWFQGSRRQPTLADQSLAWAAVWHDRLDASEVQDRSRLREQASKRLAGIEALSKVVSWPNQEHGAMEVLSVGLDGRLAEGDSLRSQIGPRGRFVLFESTAGTLVPGDGNHRQDIFFVDRREGRLQRVSIGNLGQEPNDVSEMGTLSGSGRWVAFISKADNLVQGDDNGRSDLFVHDRWTGRTRRLPRPTEPGLADGQPLWPLFAETAPVLVFEMQCNEGDQGATILLYDLERDTYEILSRSALDGSISSGRLPSISADGNLVAFQSSAPDLVAGDRNQCADIFLVDRRTRSLRRVNLTTPGQEANAWSEEPVLSGDGKWLAFRSLASNLVAGAGGTDSQLYLLELATNRIQLISRALDGGFANGYCHRACLSQDASVCVFESRASNLVAGDRGNSSFDTDVFYRDLRSQQTFAVTVTDGNSRSESSLRPRIASLGRWIVFDTKKASLVPGAIRDRAVVLADAESLPSRPVTGQHRSRPHVENHRSRVYPNERLLAADVALRALLERLR